MKMVRGMGPGAQWRADGAAQRPYRGRGNADWSRGCRDCGGPGRGEVASEKRAAKWENVRLYSLMFAYVRFIGEKCLRPAFDCSGLPIRLQPGFGERGK